MVQPAAMQHTGRSGKRLRLLRERPKAKSAAADSTVARITTVVIISRHHHHHVTIAATSPFRVSCRASALNSTAANHAAAELHSSASGRIFETHPPALLKKLCIGQCFPLVVGCLLLAASLVAFCVSFSGFSPRTRYTRTRRIRLSSTAAFPSPRTPRILGPAYRFFSLSLIHI